MFVLILSHGKKLLSLRKKWYIFVYPKFNKNSKRNMVSAWQVPSKENNINELKCINNNSWYSTVKILLLSQVLWNPLESVVMSYHLRVIYGVNFVDLNRYKIWGPHFVKEMSFSKYPLVLGCIIFVDDKNIFRFVLNKMCLLFHGKA